MTIAHIRSDNGSEFTAHPVRDWLGRIGVKTLYSEFAGKHNIRDSGTLAQMRDTVAGLVGRNLLYRDLVACNGLSSGARS